MHACVCDKSLTELKLDIAGKVCIYQYSQLGIIRHMSNLALRLIQINPIYTIAMRTKNLVNSVIVCSKLTFFQVLCQAPNLSGS